ncbi:DNA mismatch repair endonuclease MutL [Candidatus Micrarchaeota archaeon]|nr:DNA mismatch repair endonuclease MutL [Candidatus Micrarchaeota archaeon]
MGLIRLLPEDVKEKIAAGEVIERPVSVVKELIENSLDAGSTEIRIYIERGGKRLIRVTDNGRGMDLDDLRKCALRYATSKIGSESDLHRISTLGFRGEALASIAAVGELTVSSRTEVGDHGFEVRYDEHGNPVSERPVSMNRGTSVEVRNLFSRFPARLKFLKSDDTEYGYIFDLVRKYSLVSPEVGFRLFRDGKEVFVSPRGTLLDKINYAFGREVAENVIPLQFDNENIRVTGFVSKVGYTRKTKDYQAVFVNNRLVKSPEIEKAVYTGYGNRLFLNRHPVFVICLNLPSDRLDVNIHPSKRIIKLFKEHVVQRTVSEGVAHSLSQYGSVITDVENGPNTAIRRPLPTEGLSPTEKGLHHPGETDRIGPAHQSRLDGVVQGPSSGADVAKHRGFPKLKVLGQVNKTYIVCEGTDGLYLIDQHAAHERINYERYLKELKDGAVSVQTLLIPSLFRPSPKEKEVITSKSDVLRRYGYTVEEYGTNMYALKTVPLVFGKSLPLQLFRDVLDELGRMNSSKPLSVSDNSIDEIVDDRIATRSCRASVKAGDPLTLPEMERLIEQLSECSNPFTCPHGRPTIIRMGWRELEKKFKRHE